MPTPPTAPKVWTHRAPGSNADSELLPYEGVVDPMGDVVEGLCVVRADERGKEWFSSAQSITSCEVWGGLIPAVESRGATFDEGVYRSTERRQHQDHLGNDAKWFKCFNRRERNVNPVGPTHTFLSDFTPPYSPPCHRPPM